QFAMLFVFTAPIETWTGGIRIFGYLLPMTAGVGLLRDVMARSEGLNLGLLLIAWINGICYLGLGMILFRWAERETKRRGRLGEY
ncbi:MAG TPA: hypothetical protein V6C65_41070, partial [Allocoleopsis sp.]